MNLSTICIKRPVLSCVLSLVLMMIGFMAFKQLTTRYFPSYQSPRIEINTNYPGASAKLVETDITSVIENAISGVPNIETIESESQQGNSTIDLHLEPSADKQDITNQVRDKITKIVKQLPDQADTPVVRTGHNDSELMDITFADSQRSPLETQDLLNRYVTNPLSDLDGVADIQTFGADDYAMRIIINPEKLKAYQLSINDIVEAIQQNNLSLPAGQVTTHKIVVPIYTDTGLRTSQQFDRIPIKVINGTTIRISDVAKTRLDYRHINPTVSKFNGTPVVTMQINYSADANPIATAERVEDKLHQLSAQLPASLNAHIFFNEATFMQHSITEVYQNIIIAMLCVTAIILLFLGNWRAAFIPVITIPICLLSSFALLKLFGFSINVISLLALVISIGLVVDDAIVVVENCHRHIENGEHPVMAAIKGSKQLTFALIAMTLTLAAVYIPIGFQHGHSAAILRQFAFTLAGSVIISGFIALTLSPMMCARLLHSQQNTGYGNGLERVMLRLQSAYRSALTACFNYRGIVCMIALGLGVACYVLYHNLANDFIPNEDEGLVITIIDPPSWASNDYAAKLTSLAKQKIIENPNIKDTLSITSNNGDRFNAIISTLKPSRPTHESSGIVSTELNAVLGKRPSWHAHSFSMNSSSGHKDPLSFVVTGAGSYDSLYQSAKQVKKLLANYPGINHLNSSISDNTQQYSIKINHRLASELNVNTQTIDETIATLYGGNKVSTFIHNGKTYDVMVQADNNTRQSINHLNDINVHSIDGNSIPLSSLVTVHIENTQPSLDHYARNRSINFSGDISDGYTIGQVAQEISTILAHKLNGDQHIVFTGKAQKSLQSKHNNSMTFALALIFIYLVLAALFESFIDPLIILSVVPLSIFSALLALHAFGGSRNIYTDIGLITLIGLIAKHGILITQFANANLEKGQALIESVINAAVMRLRPILMTTAAMIFGALPLLLSSSASRQELGIVIVSGLTGGTFFSLILIPIIYTVLAKLKRPIASNTEAASCH